MSPKYLSANPESTVLGSLSTEVTVMLGSVVHTLADVLATLLSTLPQGVVL